MRGRRTAGFRSGRDASASSLNLAEAQGGCEPVDSSRPTRRSERQSFYTKAYRSGAYQTLIDQTPVHLTWNGGDLRNRGRALLRCRCLGPLLESKQESSALFPHA